MRILHISHRHYVAGGSDAVFMATTKLLRENGHEVVPFCIQDSRNLSSEYQKYFPKAPETGKPRLRDALRYTWNAEARRKLARLITEKGPFDVAHVHIYHGKQTPAILPVLARHRIPIVQSLHEYKLACPVYTLQQDNSPCIRCLNGSTLNALRYRCKDGSIAKSAAMWAEFHIARMLGDVRYIDRFLCVSDFQKRIMLQAGLPATKLHVLHNFVENPKNQTDPPEGLPSDYLLYAGRIEELKGLKTLINAIKQTKRPLVIAGAGNWADELAKSIADLPMVNYIGYQDPTRIAQLLAHCQGVVVPSEWYENCPMSVLEAKAAGKPVIASDIGGISELVRDGVDGHLFAAGDARHLRRCIERLNEGNSAEMGRQAQQDIHMRFSKGAYLAALIGHYDAILRKARADGPKRLAEIA